MRLARWLVAPVLLALLAACSSTPPVTYPNVQGIWYDSQATYYSCGTTITVSVTADLNQQDYNITGTIQLQDLKGNKLIYNITVGTIDTNGHLSGYSDSNPPTLFFDLTYGNGYLNGKLYTIQDAYICPNGTTSPISIEVSLQQ
jgi:hypothetical protein